ncbi:hypothetical protein QYE76_045043 [Lolium multiflorum]|uniref:Reverse transcriptase domain-containing protein n=1 Tax=Lolium multiflorum TaxID=4521 RepID=A0AAD8WXA9_LOLMU|nr:hypothetical protein QYE76_045043 [Lolium multiflorum]
MEEAEAILRGAMVASITGTRPAVSADQVARALHASFNLQAGDFTVHLHPQKSSSSSSPPRSSRTGSPATTSSGTRASRSPSVLGASLHMPTAAAHSRTHSPTTIRRRAILEVVEIIPALSPSEPPTIRTLMYPISITVVPADAAAPRPHADDESPGGKTTATTPTTLGKPQNVALAVAAASGVALTRTPRTPLAAQTAWLWTCQPGPWLGFGRALTALAGAEPGFEDKMAISRELISHFDKAQEDRILTVHEEQFRKQLKGDANTSFYHHQCTYRRQKNRIFSIATDTQVLTAHADMAEAACAYFDALLDTAVDQELTLDLSTLIELQDLHHLDEPFGANEIWNAVKRLPARKAPGPNGFTAEFLLACWPTVKRDFVDVFQQLFEMHSQGFSKLNQALLTQLPKRADASHMSDYRPISLIHLVAKIFAKVLSLRLPPRLDNLASNNQNTFIAGRSLHDNFVLIPLVASHTSIIGKHPHSPERLFKRAAGLGIMQRLYPQKLIPPISLYADDVALFCHPSAGDTAAVRQILSLFGRSSGLRVNFTKNSATPLRCSPEDTALITEQMGCPLANLPITYLGIPLTIR